MATSPARQVSRLRLLPLLLAGTSCGGSDPEPPYIPAFEAGAAPLVCTARPDLNAEELTVSDLSSAGDTLLLVLYGPEGRLDLLDTELRVTRSLRLEKSGPTGVRDPVSVAVDAAGTLHLAESAGGAVKRLSPAGADRGSIPTGFAAYRIRAAGADLYLAPLVFGSLPDRLLYRVRGDSVLPLPVPVADFQETSQRAIGNATAFVGWPDGRWLLAHSYLTTRAVTGGPDGPRSTAALPVPETARRAFRAGAPGAITEATMPSLPAGAIDAVALSAPGAALFLTRSGQRRSDGAPQAALVVVDSLLRPLRWHLLEPEARRIARLGARLVVADRASRFSVCELP